MSVFSSSAIVAKFLMVGDRFHAPAASLDIWEGQLLTVASPVITVKNPEMWVNDIPTVMIDVRDSVGRVHGIFVNSGTFVRLESELI